jgi:hypothetical protein
MRSINYESPALNAYATAKLLSEGFNEERLYLSVLSYPVWTSTYDSELMKLVLDRAGITENEIIGTRLLFDKSEIGLFRTFMHCAILFGLDVVFYQDGDGPLVFCSHDGYLVVTGFSEEALALLPSCPILDEGDDSVRKG